MPYRTVIVLLLCFLTCSCSAQAQFDDPPRGFDPQDLNFTPRLRLDAKTDADIAEFVKAHAGEQICGLELTMGACTARGLSRLSQLNGLYALQLSGAGSTAAKPVERNGHFVFGPVLSDDQFQEIAKIQSLQAIHIWYGSLSESQKALLKQKLPQCVLLENLNKI